LRVLAGAVLCLSVAAGLVAFWRPNAGVWTATMVLLGCIAAGLVGGGVLYGLARMLALYREVRGSLVRLERFEYETRGASTGSSAGAEAGAEAASTATTIVPSPETEDGRAGRAPWQEILFLLEDIRDNALLGDDDREAKRCNMADDEVRNAEFRTRSLVQEGDFAQARDLAEKIRRKYPKDERSAALVDLVEARRERHEAEDIENASKQVGDLISISAWQRARDVAQQLLERHPDSAEARQLMLRVEREHRIFQDEQRRRMYAEVQRYVSRRRWEEGLAAAQTFIERFPMADESEALRLQVPTLEKNAEIEIRQRLESEIMDFVRHGRYLEAAELSRKVIERYPTSPQAEILRAQLPRLEELAENPDAPPARIRLDT